MVVVPSFPRLGVPATQGGRARSRGRGIAEVLDGRTGGAARQLAALGRRDDDPVLGLAVLLDDVAARHQLQLEGAHLAEKIADNTQGRYPGTTWY